MPSRASRCPIYGDGRNVRDWLYVEDHCAGILAGARAGPARARSTTSAAATSARTSRSSDRLCDALERTCAGGRQPARCGPRHLVVRAHSRRSWPTARDTIGATPSTRRRSGANWGGRQRTTSSPGSSRRWGGTSPTCLVRGGLDLLPPRAPRHRPVGPRRGPGTCAVPRSRRPAVGPIPDLMALAGIARAGRRVPGSRAMAVCFAGDAAGPRPRAGVDAIRHRALDHPARLAQEHRPGRRPDPGRLSLGGHGGGAAPLRRRAFRPFDTPTPRNSHTEVSRHWRCRATAPCGWPPTAGWSGATPTARFASSGPPPGRRSRPSVGWSRTRPARSGWVRGKGCSSPRGDGLAKVPHEIDAVYGFAIDRPARCGRPRAAGWCNSPAAR